MKNRRDFLKDVCPTVAFAFFGISFLEACSSESDDDVGTTNPGGGGSGGGEASGFSVSGNVYTIDLTHSNFAGKLNSVGDWMNGNSIGIPALFLRISSSEINGYTNVCPHNKLRNSWSDYDLTTGKFICSAHGNSYPSDCTTAGNGGVLKCFDTILNNNTLILTIS